MAEVLLRPATPDDVAGLRRLGEAVVPPTYAPIDAAYAQRMLDEWWTPDFFTASLARMPYVVAESDAEVVGVANLGPAQVRGQERQVMWKLYVHPDHQGRGIGTRLLRAVEEQVEGGALWLEVVDGNEAAAGFYRSQGFEEVERAANAPWPDDLWLRKSLQRSIGSEVR